MLPLMPTRSSRLMPLSVLFLIVLLVAPGCGGRRGRGDTADNNGGNSATAATSEDSGSSKAARESRTAASQEPKSSTAPSRRTEGPAQSPPETTPPTTPEKVELPEDFAEWRIPEDFLAAKMMSDPRLAEAAAYLDKNHSEDEKAAGVLLMLLVVERTASAPDEPAAAPSNPRGPRRPSRGSAVGLTGRRIEGGLPTSVGGPGVGPPGLGSAQSATVSEGEIAIDAELAQEIVGMIGRNDTVMARRGLYQLLTGRVRTPLAAQSLFSAIVLAMADNPHEENEDKLFEIATKPGKVADEFSENSHDSMGNLEEQAVRREVLRLLPEGASESLRTRLAKYLEDPDVTQETAEEFERLLIVEDARNLPAQVLLYQNPNTTEQTRRDLDTRLADGSRAALAKLLGWEFDPSDINSGRGGFGTGGSGGFGPRRGGPPGGGRRGIEGGGGRRGRSVRDLSVGRSLAPSLMPLAGPWSPVALTDAFAQRPSRGGGRPSRGGDESGEAAEIDYLQLAKLLWNEETAKALGNRIDDASSLSEVTSELQLLASMPIPAARKQMMRALERHDEDNLGSSNWQSTNLFSGAPIDPAVILLAKEKYHNSRRSSRRDDDANNEQSPWQSRVEEFLVAAAEKCESAELPSGEDLSTDLADDATNDRLFAAFRMKLPRNAEIEAEYHVVWPQDAAQMLPGMAFAPIEMHYLRYTQDDSMMRMEARAKRLAGSTAEKRDVDGGTWYDAMKSSRSSDQKRSIDVIIRNIDEEDNDRRASEKRPIKMEIFVIEIPSPQESSEDEKQEPGEEKEASARDDRAAVG